MSLLKFDNVGIRAISCTVPKDVVKNRDLTDYYTVDQIEKFIEATGIEERRFAKENECASDLCYNAACNLFDKTDWNREDVDMLIFVTQTPDYKSPGSAIILQDRLKLKKSTLVYDLNMTCSGFIHGLLMSYTFLKNPEINNILLMVGDTLSKAISLRDKSTGMLLGDAGVATIISRGDQFGPSYFSMNTDGGYTQAVLNPAGGYRMVSSHETLTDREFEDGSIRNLEQVEMNGMDVFSFAISELPRDVKRLLEYAGVAIDDIDKYAFHQANKYMMQHIAKKLKTNPDKMLQSIHKYGNTAGVSIPLTLVENKALMKPGESVLMNAIGAGFVYGTVLMNIADCEILDLNEL
jgi:3-oxoacyl-[acyl-carrier-protein] synthase III